MNEYIFLFVLAFVWIIFAVLQDWRTREVANWLNFSLISFVLAYRAFYAIYTKEIMFFVYGLLGVLFFVVLAYVFYYGRIFAGGDAKLLMGLGGVLPFESFTQLFYFGFGFIFLLFFVGTIYSLIYSFFLVRVNWTKFKKEFGDEFGKRKNVVLFVVIFGFILEIVSYVSDIFFYGSILLFLVFLFFLLVYTKAVERGCMIKLVSPRKLREGDWLEKNVKIGNKVIKKSVHGLSNKEIKVLRRAKKSVLIKEGIPFTPAFLVALAVGVWVWRTGII